MNKVLIFLIVSLKVGFLSCQQQPEYTGFIEQYLKTKNPLPDKKNEDISGKYFVKEIGSTEYNSKKAVILEFGLNYSHVSTTYLVVFASKNEKSQVVGGMGLKKDSEDLKTIIFKCKNIDVPSVLKMYDILIENNLPPNEAGKIKRQDFNKQ